MPPEPCVHIQHLSRGKVLVLELLLWDFVLEARVGVKVEKNSHLPLPRDRKLLVQIIKDLMVE